MSFSDIPDEILTHLFFWMDFRTLINASRVCHQWQKISQRPELWKGLFIAMQRGIVPLIELGMKQTDKERVLILDDWKMNFSLFKQNLWFLGASDASAVTELLRLGNEHMKAIVESKVAVDPAELIYLYALTYNALKQASLGEALGNAQSCLASYAREQSLELQLKINQIKSSPISISTRIKICQEFIQISDDFNRLNDLLLSFYKGAKYGAAELRSSDIFKNEILEKISQDLTGAIQSEHYDENLEPLAQRIGAIFASHGRSFGVHQKPEEQLVTDMELDFPKTTFVCADGTRITTDALIPLSGVLSSIFKLTKRHR